MATEMMATDNHGASADSRDDRYEKLNTRLVHLLENIDHDLERNASGSYSEAYGAVYKATMRDGVNALLGTISIANNQVWDDVIAYGREVILAPSDSPERASLPWTRSCSDLYKELLKRFGPETIEAAKLGMESIIANHYNGKRLEIAHVDKKASFLRHFRDAKPGAAYYPQSSVLAFLCYQCAYVCGMATTSFFTAEKAMMAGSISHFSVCDDLGSFTEEDYDVRMRIIALSIGAAYRNGERALKVSMDGTGKQAVGTGDGTLRPIEAAMAWRAVGGCSTVYSEYSFGDCSLEEGLVGPISMMASHDLLDWRCDTAAGNHENAISAAYGFGIEAPFHTFLEAMLRYILTYPRPGIYNLATVTHAHWIMGRYGGWEYRGEEGRVCQDCIDLLSRATAGAGLQWAPKPPPDSFAAGEEFREKGRLLSDHFIDVSLIQDALSWFQFLISTGRIWNFDVLAKGVQPIDAGADWV